MDTDFFKARLAEQKLSQRALSRLLELDPAAISLMLRGKRVMTSAEAQQIAVHLKLPVTEVLRRGGVPVTDDVRVVRVVASASRQGVVTDLPASEHVEVNAPPNVASRSFAVQIRDVGSLQDGWIFFCSGVCKASAAHLGRLCIASIEGETALGILQRSYQLRDRFNVVTLEGGKWVDVEVGDVRTVLWIKPAD